MPSLIVIYPYTGGFSGEREHSPVLATWKVRSRVCYELLVNEGIWKENHIPAMLVMTNGAL